MIQGLWVGIALLVTLIGCGGKERQFVSGGASTDDGGSAAAAGEPSVDILPLDGVPPRSPGTACTSATECDSGSCVDGVCCRTSCDTVCTRCDAPGQEGECTVTASDPACSISCPDASECRTYGSGALSANCEAAGLCRSVTECTPSDAPAGTACAGEAGECDGLGECVVAGKKRLGEGCAADDECGQGNCVLGAGGQGICCDVECDGLCRACGADGRCSQTPRDDARCLAVDCPDDNLCRDYVDDFTVNLCRGYGTCRGAADCTFDDLRAGAECACSAEGCRLTQGAACSTGAECTSGACEATSSGSLLCCAEACASQGLICAADGSACVQCEGAGAECTSPTLSQTCMTNALVAQSCGNGCDPATGLCTGLRANGSGCDAADQCQSGLCSLDISGANRCCDPGCEGSGRVCGIDGSCVCPANRVDVDGTCRLLAGASCTTGNDCASGACTPTVSGGGVCCATACAGGFCASDGSACVECEGSGSECQGNVSERCQDNVIIRATCGNGCNAANGVCNGLLANGQTCNASNQCASTLCAPDVTNTNRCCTPNCAASGRVCGADGSCVCPDPNDVFVRGACRAIEGQSCAVDGDCRSAACESTQSAGQVCCSGACNGQICRANGQGCVQCDGGPPSCQNGSSRSCVNNAFVTTACANGCNASTGLCNNLIARGGTGCSQSSQCAGTGSSCQSGRCCEFNCGSAGRVCDNAGLCLCPSGAILVGNACLFENGHECERADQCASGRCDQWFRDADADLHGNPTQPIRTCGTASSLPPEGFVVSNNDCCDRDPDSNPDAVAQRFTAPDACGTFDRNCDGIVTNTGQFTISHGITACADIPLANCSPSEIIWRADPNDVVADANSVPECGKVGTFVACVDRAMSRQLTVCTSFTGGELLNDCL